MSDKAQEHIKKISEFVMESAFPRGGKRVFPILVNCIKGLRSSKINIGDIQCCDGDWIGALNALAEGHSSFLLNLFLSENFLCLN